MPNKINKEEKKNELLSPCPRNAVQGIGSHFKLCCFIINEVSNKVAYNT